VLEAPLGIGDLARALSARQLEDVIGDLTVRERAVAFSGTLPERTEVCQFRSHLVLDDPTSSTELAQAVEVAEHSHVRIRRILRRSGSPFAVVCALRGGHEREVGTEQHDLQAAALSSYSQIEARVARAGCRGVRIRRAHRAGEEGVAHVGARRRKDLHLCAREECMYLLFSASHRRRRRHYLRPDALSATHPRPKRVDRRLVQAHHRAEGTRDQVKLVLNDELGREERVRERFSFAGMGRAVEALGV
jgi:hypothetical protein